MNNLIWQMVLKIAKKVSKLKKEQKKMALDLSKLISSLNKFKQDLATKLDQVKTELGRVTNNPQDQIAVDALASAVEDLDLAVNSFDPPVVTTPAGGPGAPPTLTPTTSMGGGGPVTGGPISAVGDSGTPGGPTAIKTNF